MDKSDKSHLFHRNRITRNLGLNAFKPTFHFQEISSAIVHARNELIAGKQIEITPPIEELANFLEKDINQKEEINHWIAKTRLFSYHDYCKAYYTLNDRLDLAKRRDDHPGEHYEDVFAYGVCRGIADTYYKDKNLNSIIPDFEVFIKTRPMDFTRPHGWVNQSYVGIGEYLTALMTPKDMISEKMLEEFRGKFIPGESKNEFLVTYEQYLQSFEDAHSVTQIQPWSIEFCVYYVFQQRLPVKYIFDEPAPLNLPPQENHQRPDPRLYLCPSFKYFDVFTLSRYLALWEFWSEIFTHSNFLNSWHIADFISHCSGVFDFSYPNNKTRTSFWRLGIEVKNDSFSFQEQFDHWTSFFGDMFNKICFSILLESQIMALKSDAMRKKKCKTPALENAFLELFDKQRTVNSWLASQKSLDDLTPPIWGYFENYLLDFSKILPITKEHLEITQHYTKLPSVAVSSYDLVYKEYLEKYKTRLESSDLICLFTTKAGNKKTPKWDREICALNAMVTISPEKRPDSYRPEIKLSPTKASKGKINEVTSPTKIQATQKEIDELYIQFKDQNILLKAKGLSRE